MALKIAVGRVTVPVATVTKLVDARAGRTEIRFQNIQTSALSIGPDDTVTTANGYSPPGTSVPEYIFNTEGEVWAIYGTPGGNPSSKTISYLELYDDGV